MCLICLLIMILNMIIIFTTMQLVYLVIFVLLFLYLINMSMCYINIPYYLSSLWLNGWFVHVCVCMWVFVLSWVCKNVIHYCCEFVNRKCHCNINAENCIRSEQNKQGTFVCTANFLNMCIVAEFCLLNLCKCHCIYISMLRKVYC